MRYFLLFFLLLWHASHLPAQSPSYVHYGVSDGLPSNKIYCVMQDHRGFIWFGTDKGMARFDGTRFQVLGVKHGLPDPEVLNLFEDSQKRIWISCFTQKPCYLSGGKLMTTKNDPLLASVNIEASIWEYSEGPEQQVWIAGRANDVFVRQGNTMKTETYPRPVMRIEQSGPVKFALSPINILHTGTGEYYSVTTPPNDFTSAVLRNNRILYSVTDSLILMELQGDKIVDITRMGHPEGRVYKDKKGRFWICHDSQGAICFDNLNGDLSNPIEYLPNERINSMLEDRQGTIWFCTSGHGVYALSPGKAATYTINDGLLTNNVTVLSTGHKQLLAGDENGNFYRFSGNRIHSTTLGAPAEYNRCRQIYQLPGDTCWIGSDKGLFRISGKTSIKWPRRAVP